MQFWRKTGTSQKQQIVLTQYDNSNHSSVVSELLARGKCFYEKKLNLQIQQVVGIVTLGFPMIKGVVDHVTR